MRRTSFGAVIAAIVTAACGATTQADGTGNDGGARDDANTSGDGAPIDAGRDAALRPGFAPIDCTNAGSLASLSATPPFDYVEDRTEVGSPNAPTDRIDAKVGTLCLHATDVAKCKSAFAAIQHPVPITCSVPYCSTPRYLAYTRGDTVGTVLGTADMAKIAAPIDSLDEALFVLAWQRSYSCTGSSQRSVADGFDVAYSFNTGGCPSSTSDIIHDVVEHVARDGTITVVDETVTTIPHPEFGCAVARRAFGIDYAVPALRDSSDWLAAAAHLEAASVGSFARLARELAAHDAPASLIRRAARAAKEERRHGQLLRAAARREGKRVAPAPRVPKGVRSLVVIAMENAVEGETRETWGAVVAAHQARVAPEPLRADFATIAVDEATHAELAADVGAWISTRLTESEREDVARARGAAIAQLASEIDKTVAQRRAGLSEATRRGLGLPAADALSVMFDATRAQLFAIDCAA